MGILLPRGTVFAVERFPVLDELDELDDEELDDDEESEGTEIRFCFLV
jgi:hypothetical protein